MNTPKKTRLGRKKSLHLDAGYAILRWSEWFRLPLSRSLECSMFGSSNPKPVLYIFRGLPGAGKTTRARALAEEIEAYPVSADDYFVGDDGVYRFDHRDLPAAHAECQDKVRKCLMQGLDAVVHNTFTQGWELTPYVIMAEKFGAKMEILSIFDGGLDDAALAARNVHGVPEASIAAMRARWEFDIIQSQRNEPRPPWERG